MTLHRRDLNHLLLAGGAAAALPGVARAAGETPVAGGTPNWAITPTPALSSPSTPHPEPARHRPQVNEGLLWDDYDLNPQPLLATAWTISADGLRYTFHLRADVKWHDGRDFTSEDVAFTIFRLQQAHPRGRITYQNVIAVNTLDRLTAVIVLSKPAPYLITALGSSELPIVPKHVYQTFKPEEQPKLEQTIGTGPFILKEWVPGSHLLFVRNPNYWDAPKPYLDRIILRVILYPAARAAALETGEIDIGANPVPLADVARLKANPKLIVDTTTYAYSGPQQQLFFNLENEVLQNRNVRLAVATCPSAESCKRRFVRIRRRLAKPGQRGVAEMYDSSIKAYPFDQSLQQSLLDEAGYRRGADGVRFRVRLARNPFLPSSYSDFVRQSLAAVGIGFSAQIINVEVVDLPEDRLH